MKNRLPKLCNFVASSVLIVLSWSGTAPASDASALTPIETKWLAAADPVLRFAVDQGLPVDVVVRPGSSEEAPFSVAVADNRCKLILAMRSRSDAEAPLAAAPVPQHAILIEAITAHEMAHCWRYTRGEWKSFPSGMTEPLTFAGADKVATQRRAMRSVQSEEAFADLVALAWTQRQHPDQYTAVHAWLVEFRNDQPIEGGFHDTRVWLALARDASVFVDAPTPFEQVQGLWVEGLQSTGER